jgi:hypothetical protein
VHATIDSVYCRATEQGTSCGAAGTILALFPRPVFASQDELTSCLLRRDDAELGAYVWILRGSMPGTGSVCPAGVSDLEQHLLI